MLFCHRSQTEENWWGCFSLFFLFFFLVWKQCLKGRDNRKGVVKELWILTSCSMWAIERFPKINKINLFKIAQWKNVLHKLYWHSFRPLIPVLCCVLILMVTFQTRSGQFKSNLDNFFLVVPPSCSPLGSNFEEILWQQITMTYLFLQSPLSTLREDPWLSIWSGLPFTPINVFIMSTKGSNNVLPLIIECCWGNLWNSRLRSLAALTWWQSCCWGLSPGTVMNKWVNLISSAISLKLWGAEWVRYKCPRVLKIWQRLDLKFQPFLSLSKCSLKEKQWSNKIRNSNHVLSGNWIYIGFLSVVINIFYIIIW